jgi:hypothetical protein
MSMKDHKRPDRSYRSSRKDVGILAFANLTVANVVIAAAVIALFMGYLAMNNVAAATGYRIREMERTISSLQEEQKKLDLKVVERKAMRNIESQVGGLGLIPVSHVEYLGTGSSAVAVR